MALFTPPFGYARIKIVGSFDELVATRFENGVNAICWQRSLTGDFAEVAERLSVSEGVTTLDEPLLRSLPLSPAGKAAVETLLADQRLLESQGLSPVLDCIHSYPRDEEGCAVAVDVYSFHADSAPVETDTYLCTYTGPSSEGLRNDEAVQRIAIPETRAVLLNEFNGEEGPAFNDYLGENCFDLHYVGSPLAQPFSFGLHNLWRIATQYPGCPVPPCIHRAPAAQPDQSTRLLLIS